MTNNSLSGYASDLRFKHEQQEKSVSKRTLGMVARNFVDGPPVQTIPDEVSEVYLSATVQIELSEANIEEIESLVAERNALIHHFLDDVDFQSPTSLAEAASGLDEQKLRLDKTLDKLRILAKAASDCRKGVAAQLASGLMRK